MGVSKGAFPFMFIAPFDKTNFIMPDKSDFYVNRKTNYGPFAGVRPADYTDIDKDKFLSSIEQYQGTDYYDQLLNAYNAYAGQSYNPNDFQAMAYNLFSDASGFLNFQNSRLATFQDSYSRILEAMHQEKYDSAEQQAMRERNAGLNPDIAGGIQPGQAGNIDQREMPVPTQVPNQTFLPEVASQAMEAISLSMNLAKGFQDLSAGDIGLMLGSINLRDKSNQSILDSLGDMLSENDIRILLDPFAEDVNKKRKFSDDDRLRAQSNLSSAMQMIIGDKRLSSSLRRRLKNSFAIPYSGSIHTDSKLYKLLEDTYSHKKNAVANAGHPFTNGGFESCLTKIGEHIQKTVIDIEKLNATIANKDSALVDKRLEVEGQQLGFESDRLNVKGSDGSSLGSLAGKSDSASFTAEAYQKQYDSIVNKMWDDVMKDLQKENTWWSKLLSFSIPIVRLWLGSIKMPSVSHSTSSVVGKNGQPTYSSSTSFGF